MVLDSAVHHRSRLTRESIIALFLVPPDHVWRELQGNILSLKLFVERALENGESNYGMPTTASLHFDSDGLPNSR